MNERTITYEMPGQAAINALKLLKPARRPLMKSVVSLPKRIVLWMIPDEAAVARIAARRTYWI